MSTGAPRFDYIIYNGSNGAAVVAFCAPLSTQPLTLVSDTGGVLTISSIDPYGNPISFTFNTGDRLGILPGQYYPSKYSQVDIDAQYVTIPAITGMGIANVPAIGAGGNTVITVNLSTDMGGTGYTTAAILNGAVALLTNLAITATSIINSHQISVTVHNNGLIASSPVQVLAMAI